MLGVVRIFAPVLALFVFGACASSKLEDFRPLPPDIPAELQARFSVVEKTGLPAPAASSTPAPKPVVRKVRVSKPKAAPATLYPDRRPKVMPIWVGESQILEITYIGIKAGDFTLDVLPSKEIAGRPVFHLRARAVSSAMMDLFYRVNDSIESFWDARGLFSHRFHLVVDETRQKRDALELYNHDTKQDYYWDRRNHVQNGISEKKETFDIAEAFSQDSFTALYYLRTLPLEPGKTYTIPVVSEGKSWEAVINVLRRETMDTPLGKKSCIVLSFQTRFQGVMRQSSGDSLIWLTDDDRRFIVRLQAQIKVGAISARLKSVEVGELPND